jgi:hypothetical protein
MVHLPNSANMVKMVTLMELHHHMGHIAPFSAQCLVKTTTISRLSLVRSSCSN